MRCGYCNYTDGLGYPTNPMKVYCRLAGDYKIFGAECDAIKTARILTPEEVGVAIGCLICGEDVPVDYNRASCGPIICDKCTAAVMHVRENME